MKLTYAHVGAGSFVALALACSQVEVPAAPPPAVTSHEAIDAQAKRLIVEPDAAPDASDEEDKDDDENEADKEDEEKSGPPDAAHHSDAGKHKGDAGDAGKQMKRKSHADAGDAGSDAGVVDCNDYEENNSDLDLFECDEFESEDCASYAASTCQDMHFTMDHNVFAAFIECLSETPGLDLCDEDQSTAKECEKEAKSKVNVCLTHQVGCEAYEGCDTMSVDECDKAVAIFSTSAIETVSEFFGCDTDPTYFFGD